MNTRTGILSEPEKDGHPNRALTTTYLPKKGNVMAASSLPARDSRVKSQKTSKLETILCETCGIKFSAYKKRGKSRRFCSRKCAPRGWSGAHKESRTRLHNIWCGVKSRCNS